MFLSQTSIYALRAMTELSLHEGEKLLRASELSRSTGVPQHYLSKIMRKMVEADLVQATKGHGGGFELRVPASRITIMDVLTASGFDMDGQPCVFGWERCDNENPCPLHPVWSKLKDDFSEWACCTTFEDIRRENGRIQDMERWQRRE